MRALERYTNPSVHVTVVLSVGVLAVFVVMLSLAVVQGYWKVAFISTLACLAMLTGAGAARWLPVSSQQLAWVDGLAAGSMITSACLFLLPGAMRNGPAVGGLGVAAGLLTGLVLQIGLDGRYGRRPPGGPAVVSLTLHALAAGLVIGTIYGRMPQIGSLLGIAIVSHKMPAGYAAARNLTQDGMSLSPILWPACAVGLTSLPVAMLIQPAAVDGHGALFGFATGIFLQVALNCALSTGLRRAWHWSLTLLIGGVVVVALRQWVA